MLECEVPCVIDVGVALALHSRRGGESGEEESTVNDIATYVDKLNSPQLEDRLWAATFAYGVDDAGGQLIEALLNLLERACNVRPALLDMKYELCIGRAAVNLAYANHKLDAPVCELLSDRILQVLSILAQDKSIEIAHHAKRALDVLSGAQ